MAFQCFERSERKKTWTLLSAHFVETQKSSDRAFIPSADKLFLRADLADFEQSKGRLRGENLALGVNQWMAI